ncbi:MAG: CPBP family intramembrane metalloprotease [Chitinophagaceae bacterium]|jgi:membrane protease YdiL (CAAX protease family)|nr:MAG: CPBP family intramembrane metalloprotease [Chitinophagaceae bacterium]
MEQPARTYRFKDAVTAFIFIAAAYLFMYGKFIKFPYNIPAICLIIIAGYFFSGRSFSKLGIKKIQQPGKFLLTALLLALAAEVIMDWLVQPLVNKLFDTPPDYSYFSMLEGKTPLFVKYLLYMWLSAAFGEELLFRGFMFDQLSRLIPPARIKTALIFIIAGLLFGFAHGYEGPAGMAITFLWGILFGIIYKRTGNIWLTILVHGCIDTVFLVLAYTGHLSWYELPNQLIWGY